METTTKKITRIISGNETIPIGNLNGRTTISRATDVFKWISPDFKKFGLDKPGRPTEKINVVVHELIKDGTFLQIFTDINPNFNESVMTFSQIIEFCEKNPGWLSRPGFTLFLAEKRRNIFQKVFDFIFNRKSGKYFVVRVVVHSVGLYVYVYRLERGNVWVGRDRPRVVSPQLIPLVA